MAKDREKLLDQQQIVRMYGISKKEIQKYFPRPQLKTVRGRGGGRWKIGVWPEEQVEKLLKHTAESKGDRKNDYFFGHWAMDHVYFIFS